MIRTSEQTNELADAFTKAQAKFGAAIKASQNPAFRSKYADLASVIDATLEHLNSEGVGVMQHPALRFYTEGEERIALVTVTTRLQHKGGQWMESDMEVPAVQRDRFDAQSVGSAITYACRYALRSICTVPQADDDANAASGVGSSEAAQEVAKTKLKQAAESSDPKIKKIAEQGLANMEPTLFYVWHDESQTAEITGPESLKTANKDLLKPLWSAAARSIICNAEQLESLKYELEQRKVKFHPLKAA